MRLPYNKERRGGAFAEATAGKPLKVQIASLVRSAKVPNPNIQVPIIMRPRGRGTKRFVNGQYADATRSLNPNGSLRSAKASTSNIQLRKCSRAGHQS